MYNFADSTVTASAFTAGANTGLTLVASTAGLTTTAALVIYYDDQVGGISGTVTANAYGYSDNDAGFFPIPLVPIDEPVSTGKAIVAKIINGTGQEIGVANPFDVSITNALPAGTNRIGVVTIGAGTVTIGAGTAQIGSVTASISGTVPVSGTFFQGTQPVSLTTLPTLAAGTAQIGSVTASISGTVPISISSVTVGNSVTIGSLPDFIGGGYNNLFNLGDDGNLFVQANVTNLPSIPAGTNQIGTVTANTFAVQGTAVTTSNFTSTTASTVLANYNATREVLTIFNEGAGNLHIAPGATCTTIAYQVRLSAGDYFEVPSHQTTITHSAVYATAGTARICQLS
jgi:hypothetical protein